MLGKNFNHECISGHQQKLQAGSSAFGIGLKARKESAHSIQRNQSDWSSNEAVANIPYGGAKGVVFPVDTCMGCFASKDGSNKADLQRSVHNRTRYLETKCDSLQKKGADFSKKEATWQNTVADLQLQVHDLTEPVAGTNLSIGKTLLKARGLFVDEYWYWICIAALGEFSLLFNILFIVALAFMNPIGETKSVILEEDSEDITKRQPSEGIDIPVRSNMGNTNVGTINNIARRGMVLPFELMS